MGRKVLTICANRTLMYTACSKYNPPPPFFFPLLHRIHPRSQFICIINIAAGYADANIILSSAGAPVRSPRRRPRCHLEHHSRIELLELRLTAGKVIYSKWENLGFYEHPLYSQLIQTYTEPFVTYQ
jgi:hypothetical protein